MTQLRAFLLQAKKRLNARRATVWGVRGLSVAGAAMLAVGLVGRRRPLGPVWRLWAAAGFAGALVAVIGWVRDRPSVADVARMADRNLAGADRVSTAWELRGAHGPLVARQRSDAVAWARGADPRSAVTLRPRRRELAAAAVVVLAAAGLAALPNPALARQRSAATERAVRDKAADAVAELANQAAAGGQPGEDRARREALVKALRRSEEAIRETGSSEGAVAALSRAQETLRELGDQSSAGRANAAAAAGSALSRSSAGTAAGAALAAAGGAAARELGQLAARLPTLSAADRATVAAQLAEAATGAGDPADAAALQQAADELADGRAEEAQKALSEAASHRQQADAAAAAQALEDLAASLASRSPAERAELAQALEDAARAAGDDRPLADPLSSAASALRKGDTTKAADALRTAGQQAKSQPARSDLDAEVAKKSNELEGLKTEFTDPKNRKCGTSSFGAGKPEGPAPTAPKADGKESCGGKSAKDATKPAAAPGGSGGGGAAGAGQGGTGKGASGQGATEGTGGANPGNEGKGGGGPFGAVGSLGSAPGAPSERVYVPGLPGQGRTEQVAGGGSGLGADTGLVPYESVYAQYRDSALRQADRQVIPEELRELLSEYFRDGS